MTTVYALFAFFGGATLGALGMSLVAAGAYQKGYDDARAQLMFYSKRRIKARV